eukprot:2240655-Rhodomonas_salina.1
MQCTLLTWSRAAASARRRRGHVRGRRAAGHQSHSTLDRLCPPKSNTRHRAFSTNCTRNADHVAQSSTMPAQTGPESWGCVLGKGGVFLKVAVEEGSTVLVQIILKSAHDNGLAALRVSFSTFQAEIKHEKTHSQYRLSCTEPEIVGPCMWLRDVARHCQAERRLSNGK